MRTLLLFGLLLLTLPAIAQGEDKEKEKPKLEAMQAFRGYFNFFWDESQGKIWLQLPVKEEEFLLVHGLPAGLGSNDIGLDRGQISSGRVVSFRRAGNKALLTESNYGYRAISDNPAERRAVREAFAESVIWGFEIKQAANGTSVIDLTPMLLSDQHGITKQLESTKQGEYKLNTERSAVFPERLRAFPENCEFEATLTFKGNPGGEFVRSVTPTPELISLRQHLSFVKLPDGDYEPRPHLPGSGFFYIDYFDYAQPIEQPLQQRFIARHRLEKKAPNARRSEAVEPIVYYLDPGTPEPVRSALLEGARWWNEAFEAAGYIDAFRVEMLPEGADPMDVRYNLIQWVHRSTRGWSYGASVIDPRTGEIIKGHVSLGSLRVRQDFLIAQGLTPLYANGAEPDPEALEMALARLRQLSAHEVGHTLGLAHNFAASTQDRASVMDYPHPILQQRGFNRIDFRDAYATGIGEWDIRAIGYGYQNYPKGSDADARSAEYLQETFEEGFRYISDRDARPPGSASAVGHLWDNGDDLVRELNRIMELRSDRLYALNEDYIAPDAPWFELERLLTPLYLAHRYQVEAVAKLIGGAEYSYVRDGNRRPVQVVPERTQNQALRQILQTLSPQALCLPPVLLEMIPPPPPGYERGREFFPAYTDPMFDPVGAAEAAALHTLSLLLAPERMARIARQYAQNERSGSLTDYLEQITLQIFTVNKRNAYETQVAQAVESVYLEHLFRLARTKKPDAAVAAAIQFMIDRISSQLESEVADNPNPHDEWLLERIRLFRTHPDTFEPLPEPKVPPGSPIGCGH